MLDIVVPMAGRGSRFADAGFTTPKPLIPINNKAMIEWVVGSIRPSQEHRFIFICQKRHLEEYPEVRQKLEELCPNCVIIELNGVTEGAACTVLAAKEYIDSEDPLMIANSDQYVECDMDAYLGYMDQQDARGLIMTFEANDPKWSYCRMDKDSKVTEVVEKEVVSNLATVGIYNFKEGKDFVEGAERMISEDIRVKGEFYVAPVYNQIIERGAKVVTYSIEGEGVGMYGLGTPEDLEVFVVKKSPFLQKA